LEGAAVDVHERKRFPCALAGAIGVNALAPAGFGHNVMAVLRAEAHGGIDLFHENPVEVGKAGFEDKAQVVSGVTYES
jgi:hypothetical protein